MKKWPAVRVKTERCTFIREAAILAQIPGSGEHFKQMDGSTAHPPSQGRLKWGRLRVSDYDYKLPEELIAQKPCLDRDQSRLMVVERQSQRIEHRIFRELPAILSQSDLLVLNDSKVYPARLLARKARTGNRIELLLVRALAKTDWICLARPARRLRPGTRLLLEEGGMEALVLKEGPAPFRTIRFEYKDDFLAWLDHFGRTPLPPYIHRGTGNEEFLDRDRYQTVYARHPGSIAAPTAGLHFTPSMLQQFNHCFLTLHVGYGTFKPLQGELVEAHQMESEQFEIGEETAAKIRAHQQNGERIIAVGSTSTRVLEHIARKGQDVVEQRGSTDLFIVPGFQFRVVSGLITNFHLPCSTLLLLVSAFAGKELIEKCYREAIAERYRFYSFGDAMLIL